MWGKSEELKLVELGLTKAQIDELSDKTKIGVGLITEILLAAKKSEIIVIPKDKIYY